MSESEFALREDGDSEPHCWQEFWVESFWSLNSLYAKTGIRSRVIVRAIAQPPCWSEFALREDGDSEVAVYWRWFWWHVESEFALREDGDSESERRGPLHSWPMGV